MADGDVLQLGIPGPYANAYRQICDGSGTPAEWARKTAEGVKQFLTWYGDEPRQLVNGVALLLAPVAHNPAAFSRSTWIALEREMSRLQRSLPGHKEGMSFAASVCHGLLNDLQRGLHVADVSAELARRFVAKVHHATFASRVETAPRHLDNVDRTTVQERMEVAAPAVQSYLDSMSRQWLCPPNNGLRLPPRPRPEVTIDTEFE